MTTDLGVEQDPRFETKADVRVRVDHDSTELASAEPPFVLDVRTAREWRQKQIERSVNVSAEPPFNASGRAAARSAHVGECAGGYRSSIGARLLQPAGLDRLVDLAGGLAAWEAAKLPL